MIIIGAELSFYNKFSELQWPKSGGDVVIAVHNCDVIHDRLPIHISFNPMDDSKIDFPIYVDQFILYQISEVFLLIARGVLQIE